MRESVKTGTVLLRLNTAIDYIHHLLLMELMLVELSSQLHSRFFQEIETFPPQFDHLNIFLCCDRT